MPLVARTVKASADHRRVRVVRLLAHARAALIAATICPRLSPGFVVVNR